MNKIAAPAFDTVSIRRGGRGIVVWSDRAPAVTAVQAGWTEGNERDDRSSRPSGISNAGTRTADEPRSVSIARAQRGITARCPRSLSVRIVRTVSELRAALAGRPRGPVGLVPTMGAFHEGHLSLMRRALAECETVVVSLFVNPTQFVPGEDLESYPRDEQRDLALATEAGVDLVFAPALDEVYPEGFSTTVAVSGVSEVLCGSERSRGAAHFHGVATVVAKLLNACRPDVAYFGQKDYQQALVVRRLVTDLDLPVRIEVCPTVRDPDGLALSSRNAYLSANERNRALSLKRSLDAAERMLAAGPAGPAEVLAAACAELAQAGIEVEYVELLRAEDLEPPRWTDGERLVVAVAARIGRARLIDNVITALRLPGSAPRLAGDRTAEPVPG
jgi:pantoate--beta-alanine ligase